jgi:hypothetical protein
MRITRYLTGMALAVLVMPTQAQAPFQINGLHPDLVFTDALAMVEKLGGQCRIKHSRTEGGGVGAQCAFANAGAPDRTGAAEQPDAQASMPMIGPQPITRIGFEAPIDSAQVTRIVFVFDGGLDAVAQYLVQQYGQPEHDGTASDEKSWSHAKRRAWSKGIYTMGLSNSPDVVILTVNRPPPDPGAS